MKRDRSEKLQSRNPTIIFRYKSFAGLSCFLAHFFAACSRISPSTGRVIRGPRLRATPREPPSFWKPAACFSRRRRARLARRTVFPGTSGPRDRFGGRASSFAQGESRHLVVLPALFVRRGPRNPRRSRGRRNCNRRSHRGETHGDVDHLGNKPGHIGCPTLRTGGVLSAGPRNYPAIAKPRPSGAWRRLLVGRRERRRVGNRRDAGIRPTAWRNDGARSPRWCFWRVAQARSRHGSSADRCRSTCASRGATAPAVLGRTPHPRSTSRWQASLRQLLTRGGGLLDPLERYDGW